MKRSVFIYIITLLILILSVRGLAGNPNDSNINNPSWINIPFPLSPERGRFALIYSWAENRSPFFTLPIARFTTPDLGYKNGHFVSLFAPGVSFIALPGYLLGKYFNLSQVGSFMVISIVASLNFILVKSISKKLGASELASAISASVFLFASPAFSYATTLYQHHISTFLILLAIYILVNYKNIGSLFFIWFLCAASIPVDYPNLFLMFPIGIAALGRLIHTRNSPETLSIRINLFGFLTALSALLPLLFFLWFNNISYGNPLQFSGTVASVKYIDNTGKPAEPVGAVSEAQLSNATSPEVQQKSALGFFRTRNLINGFYIHLFSPDRGIIFYSPVLLFGIIGIFLLSRKNTSVTSILVGILLADLILYSLWGDPWGGWAFGSRYLIPGYAILSIFLSAALTKYLRNLFFIVPFTLLLIYSISVNTSGALTSIANPPRIEILSLEQLSGKVQKFTYARNWDLIAANQSTSFIYNNYLKSYYSLSVYYYFIAGLIICSVIAAALLYVRDQP